jgi:hypothetical protein
VCAREEWSKHNSFFFSFYVARRKIFQGEAQTGGQNQKAVFCPANGGSAGKARNKMKILFPIFSFPHMAEYEASFSLFSAEGKVAKGNLLKIKE